ncbi:MAG: hypothetical protein Q8N16_04170 [bacterium]|nr:hypothetical protein [bacterium]
MPVATLRAADEPVECCRMVKDMKVSGVNYSKNDIVGPGDAASANCPLGNIVANTDNWGVVCFLNMLNIVINWIFIALMILVIILTLSGAFNLMTSAGDVEKVKTGRDRIMYAAIGLVVALIARAIPSIVKAIFG